MTRFISRYGAYTHGVQDEVAEPLATGKRILQRELEAKFEVRLIRPYEIELGLKELHHHGQLEDRIEGGDVSPVSRISAFDSELTKKQLHWTDADHDLVVKTMRESELLGVDFIESHAPKIPAPWNGYDELVGVEAVLAAVEATGVDPYEVIKYEQENANRGDVIKALASLGTVELEGVVIEAG